MYIRKSTELSPELKHQKKIGNVKIRCISLQPVELEIILKWLPSLYTEHYGTADVAVRSLKFAKEPFDPSVLIDLFENSDFNFLFKIRDCLYID